MALDLINLDDRVINLRTDTLEQLPLFCPRDEVLTLRWDYVNWEVNALILPDSKTGNKTIPLSAPARLVLERLPVLEGNEFIAPQLGFPTISHWDVNDGEP